MGDRKSGHIFLVGKLEGRRPLRGSSHIFEDNIKIYFREMGEGVDWMDLAQDRNMWRALVNATINLRVA